MEKKRVLLKMAPQPVLHTDPVCGMKVDPASAADSFDYNGTRYYFCMPGCRKKFEADPNNYLSPAPSRPGPSSAMPAGTIYTCPMHPEVRQDRPGSCPKCGMAL